MMQIQYTKNLNPGRFELGTTLSYRKRSNKRPLSNKRLLSNKRPPYTVKLVLNVPSLINAPLENCPQILGNGEIEGINQFINFIA